MPPGSAHCGDAGSGLGGVGENERPSTEAKHGGRGAGARRAGRGGAAQRRLLGILALDDDDLQPATLGVVACDDRIGGVVGPPLAQEAAAPQTRPPEGVQRHAVLEGQGGAQWPRPTVAGEGGALLKLRPRWAFGVGPSVARAELAAVREHALVCPVRRRVSRKRRVPGHLLIEHVLSGGVRFVVLAPRLDVHLRRRRKRRCVALKWRLCRPQFGVANTSSRRVLSGALHATAVCAHLLVCDGELLLQLLDLSPQHLDCCVADGQPHVLLRPRNSARVRGAQLAAARNGPALGGRAWVGHVHIDWRFLCLQTTHPSLHGAGELLV